MRENAFSPGQAPFGGSVGLAEGHGYQGPAIDPADMDGVAAPQPRRTENGPQPMLEGLISQPVGHPPSATDRHRRAVLFAATSALALLLAALPPDGARAEAIWAGLLFGLLVLAMWRVPWSRLPAAAEAVPPLLFLGAVALLRDAAGGLGSGLVPLTLLPIVWLALYHSRLLLVVGLTLLEVVMLAPIVVVGGPQYPPSEWRRAVLMGTIAGAIGLTTGWLVNRLRTQLRDVTLAEARTREQARLNSAILDHTAALVMVSDTDGRLVTVNRAWQKTTGYPATDARGRRLWDMIGEPAASAYWAGWFAERTRQVHHGQPAGSHPEALHTRDGQRRSVIWSEAGLHDDHGRLTHVVLTGIDVTEQHNTERLLERVLEAATGQALIGTDLTGTINVFNAGAEQLLGYRAGDVIGQRSPLAFHLPAELAALGVDTETDAFAAIRDSSGSREWTYVRADGSHVIVSLAVTEIRDDGGSLMGYLGTARDVTAERAAAEANRQAYERERLGAERLRELDRARTRFVEAASHDLRTPLTAVISFLELLDAETDLTDGQRGLLDATSRNAQRLLTRVTNLITIAQLDAGTLRLDRRHTVLDDVVRAAVDALAVGIADRGLQVVVTHQSSAPVVDVDAEHLTRALTNLVDNAVKFSPEGGRIHISTRDTGAGVEVRVSDDGPGIPVGELDGLFQRFYRSSTTDGVVSGTGLGLAITAGIVEAHGGNISAASTPGHGTTVRFTVPRA